MNLSMSWESKRQVISCDSQIFIHDGPIATNPSHDLAHLLIAANGELPWRPDGEDVLVRLAEYNAVFIEHLFNESYNCVVDRSIKPKAILSAVLCYTRWFVERHFAPFPVWSEEAYRRLCWNLDISVMGRLSPHYYDVRRKERRPPALRAQEYSLSFTSADCPQPEGDGIAFQDVVTEQLSRLVTPGL